MEQVLHPLNLGYPARSVLQLFDQVRRPDAPTIPPQATSSTTSSAARTTTPRRSSNGGGFCRHDFDRLVVRAQELQVTDPAKAQKVWAWADPLAVDQAAWVPTVSTASFELLSARTGHFTLDANSQPQIDQLWVR